MKPKQILYLFITLALLSGCGPNFYFVVRDRGESTSDTIKKTIKIPDSRKNIPPYIFKPNPGMSCRVIHTGYYYDPETGRYKHFTYSCGEVNFDYPYVITAHQYEEMQQH